MPTSLARLLLIWAAAALTLAGDGCRSPEVRPAQPKHGPLSGVTIILDPGHGGTDSGAVSGHVREDTINYRMASTIAAALCGRGATIVYTVDSSALITNLCPTATEPPLLCPHDARLRLNNVPVTLRRDEAPDDLYRRAAIGRDVWQSVPGNRKSRLYFLSLHCDKLGSERGRGARVYCDRHENAAAPPGIAAALKRHLTDAGLTNSQGGMVIPRRYGVLNTRYNPIPQRALLEMATLSNPDDRRAVQNPAWRWRFAEIVADAFAECEGVAP